MTSEGRLSRRAKIFERGCLGSYRRSKSGWVQESPSHIYYTEKKAFNIFKAQLPDWRRRTAYGMAPVTYDPLRAKGHNDAYTAEHYIRLRTDSMNFLGQKEREQLWSTFRSSSPCKRVCGEIHLTERTGSVGVLSRERFCGLIGHLRHKMKTRIVPKRL